jgi:hypothetical protein
MAAYAQRHYGVYTSSFGIPKQVILHYTVSPTYSSTWNWMAANSAAPGNAGTKKEKRARVLTSWSRRTARSISSLPWT